MQQQHVAGAHRDHHGLPIGAGWEVLARDLEVVGAAVYRRVPVAQRAIAEAVGADVEAAVRGVGVHERGPARDHHGVVEVRHVAADILVPMWLSSLIS